MLTKFQGDLVKALNPADIFLYLETNNLLTPDEKQIVDRQNTLDGAKVLQLLRVMAYKDGWWNALMDFLEIQSKFSLREELMKDMAKRT